MTVESNILVLRSFFNYFFISMKNIIVKIAVVLAAVLVVLFLLVVLVNISGV